MMRWLGILGVLAYRAFVRPFMRRRCLHDESCSAHAIRLLRAHGLRVAVPQIRARVRSCRMPVGACMVMDSDGVPRLLSIPGHDVASVPARALELIALDAQRAAQAHARRGVA